MMPHIAVKPSLTSEDFTKGDAIIWNKTEKNDKIGDEFNEKSTDNSESSVKARWEGFRNETSLHGIQHVNFRQRVRGVIWALALAAMVGLLLNALVNLHQAYYSYPTYTSTNIEMADVLTFPAVTVCNLSPFNKTRLNPDAVLTHFFLKLSNLGALLPYMNLSDPMYSDLWKEGTKDLVENTSFNINDFMTFCVFKTQLFQCGQYFRPRLTEWGICFTFNDVREEPALTTEHTGSVTALTIYIKIDQANYIFGENLGAGIKVVLHERDEEPNVRDQGFLASPGFATYASIRMMKYKYQEPPFIAFGNKYCTNTKSSTFINPLKYFKHYSYFACMKECKEIYVYKQCNCCSLFDHGNVSVCSYKDYAECYKINSDRFDTNVNEKGNCSCPLPCETTEYVPQISATYFPSDINIQQLEDFGFTNIRNDYLEVRVFYDSLKYTTVEQVPKYTLTEIAATLGGQMGIFIGASFLTLMELLEFVLLAIFTFIKSRLFVRTRH